MSSNLINNNHDNNTNNNKNNASCGVWGDTLSIHCQSLGAINQYTLFHTNVHRRILMHDQSYSSTLTLSSINKEHVNRVKEASPSYV